jgi:segregation and condensation protein B
VIGQLRGLDFIAAGPRSPQSSAPYTYVTTKQFLSHFGFDTLRDLPDMNELEEAGLLSKQKLLAGALPGDLSQSPDLIHAREEGREDVDAEEPPLALSAKDL